MTTQSNPAVVVVSGCVLACAWCCTRPQLVALDRAYPGTVSHGMCPACTVKMTQEAA
jgi:hypothetical protein